MRGYRITKRKHLRTAWSGEGAFRAPGRWNSAGVRMVYTAESAALATLEMLVHLDQADLTRHYAIAWVEVPDELVTTIDVDDLPANWQDTPAPLELRAIGDRWCESQESVGLRVPSAVIRSDSNLLINPAHPRFNEISLGEFESYRFDPRLRRGK